MRRGLRWWWGLKAANVVLIVLGILGALGYPADLPTWIRCARHGGEMCGPVRQANAEVLYFLETGYLPLLQHPMRALYIAAVIVLLAALFLPRRGERTTGALPPNPEGDRSGVNLHIAPWRVQEDGPQSFPARFPDGHREVLTVAALDELMNLQPDLYFDVLRINPALDRWHMDDDEYRRRFGHQRGEPPHLNRGLADIVRDSQREQADRDTFPILLEGLQRDEYSRRRLDDLTAHDRERLFSRAPEMKDWWHGRPRNGSAWSSFRLPGGRWITKTDFDALSDRERIEIAHGYPEMIEWWAGDRQI